jgi:hypothetical protein
MTQNNAQSFDCVTASLLNTFVPSSQSCIVHLARHIYHGSSVYKTKTLAQTRSNDDFTQIEDQVPILTSLRIRSFKDKRLTVTKSTEKSPS